MAEDSWPASGRAGGAVTVVEHQLLAGNWAGCGVVGASDLSVSTSAAQSQVLISTGTGAMQGTVYTNNQQLALAVPSNNSGSTRVDRAVIRLNKATGAANAFVIQGTPGAGAPGTSNDNSYFDLPLARYTVVSGQLPTAPVDERRFLGGDSTASASGNPPVGAIRTGHRWYQTDTATDYLWNGASWVAAVPTLPTPTQTNLSGYRKSATGHATGTTQTDGSLTVYHGLGVVPTFVGCVYSNAGANIGFAFAIGAMDTNNFTAYLTALPNGAYPYVWAGHSTSFYWTAVV